jgi:hypothetical protein
MSIFDRFLSKFKSKKKDKSYMTTFDSSDSQLVENISWNSTAVPDSNGYIAVLNTINNTHDESTNMVKEVKDERIEKKPIEIFEEILIEEPKFEISNLNKQIKMVEERMKVLKDYTRTTNFRDEMIALGYLKARKQFKKTFRLFAWKVTTSDKISALCKKYKVMKVSIESYYRNLPMEAITEIKKFIEVWKKVRKELPIFELIVDQGGKEQKKDPILLAPSPFGNWYYILGAWDKEVEIVDKLVYKGG